MKTAEIRVIPTLVVFALAGLFAFYFPAPKNSAFTPTTSGNTSSTL